MKHQLFPFLFLLSPLFFIGNVTAQTFEWAKKMGGVDYDDGISIAVDAFGNIFTTGYFQDTVDFDPGIGTYNLVSAGSFDIFISKLNPFGHLLWAKKIGGTSSDLSYSIVLDSIGNIYLTGYFGGTVDFDPGPGTYNLTSAGYSDIFICKLDTSGNFVWAKKMGGIEDELGCCTAVDDSGNVYTTGRFYGTVDFDPGPGTLNFSSAGNADIFVSKLDALGNFVWAKQMGGVNGEFTYSIALDDSGNVYTTGYFNGTADFDPGPGTFNLTSAGNADIFVSKLNASGNFVWAKRMGGTSHDEGNSIALDSVGNVYTTGYFGGTVDFDPGSGIFNLNTAGAQDIFVSKLDASGNFVWAKQMGGTGPEEGHSITLDDTGNVYTTGNFAATADFDPGSGTFNLTSSGGFDIFVSKLNSSGNFLWAKKMSGTSSEVGNSINVDASGNVYTTGYFENTVDFDPGSGTFNLSSLGRHDIFVSKLSQCINSSSSQSFIACDSYTWIDNVTYTSSNNSATHTLTNALGCDSVVTLDLTINNSNTGIDAITACDSYTWIDNVTYTSSTNTPTFTLTNSFGCDSVLTLDLTINSNDTSISVNNDTLTANQQGASYQWLNCDSSHNAISGETAQLFTPSQNGRYACEISLNGCVDTTACVQVIVTGIEKNAFSEEYKIYPNPFADQITIESVGVHLNTQVEVINIKGQVVYETTTLLNGKTVLNTADWSKGIYIIRLTNEQGVGTYKLVHQ